MSPRVFIIILQFNNSRSTITCLESVKELNYPNYQVLIVDNGSSTEHLNNIRFFLESRMKLNNFKLIASQGNLGYSGGNNLGVKHAIGHGADYVLILNNDTVVGKDLLTKLVKVCEADKNIGLAGPVIKESGPGRAGEYIYGGRIRWLKPELEHIKNSDYIAPGLNKYIIGACMFIRKKIIEKIGFFDERYFLYFEDADYSQKAKRVGYKLELVPNITIEHSAQVSTSQLGTPLLLRYHYRNAHLFNLKNAPFIVKILLPFWSLVIIIKQLIKLLLMPDRRTAAKAILTGVFDFYRGRFGKINV